MSAFRVALVALSAAVLTAGCAAGQHAATANEKPSIDGTQGRVGSIQLENVSMRAPSGASYAAGSDVPMTVYIVNNGRSSDALTGVTSSAFTSGWEVVASATLDGAAATAPIPTTSSAAGSPRTIAPGAALGLGLQNLSAGGQTSAETLLLKGLKSRLFPGSAIQITFSFANAGKATLTVPVQVGATPNTQTLPAIPSSAA